MHTAPNEQMILIPKDRFKKERRFALSKKRRRKQEKPVASVAGAIVRTSSAKSVASQRASNADGVNRGGTTETIASVYRCNDERADNSERCC